MGDELLCIAGATVRDSVPIRHGLSDIEDLKRFRYGVSNMIRESDGVNEICGVCFLINTGGDLRPSGDIRIVAPALRIGAECGRLDLIDFPCMDEFIEIDLDAGGSCIKTELSGVGRKVSDGIVRCDRQQIRSGRIEGEAGNDPRSAHDGSGHIMIRIFRFTGGKMSVHASDLHGTGIPIPNGS